jgi:hypothetical protein
MSDACPSTASPDPDIGDREDLHALQRLQRGSARPPAPRGRRHAIQRRESTKVKVEFRTDCRDPALAD